MTSMAESVAAVEVVVIGVVPLCAIILLATYLRPGSSVP